MHFMSEALSDSLTDALSMVVEAVGRTGPVCVPHLKESAFSVGMHFHSTIFLLPEVAQKWAIGYVFRPIWPLHVVFKVNKQTERGGTKTPQSLFLAIWVSWRGFLHPLRVV